MWLTIQNGNWISFTDKIHGTNFGWIPNFFKDASCMHPYADMVGNLKLDLHVVA
jgi:hypothetical protein